MRYNVNYTAMVGLQTEEIPIPDGLMQLTDNDISSPHRYGPQIGDSTNAVSWIWGRRLGKGGREGREAIDFWVKDGV